VSIIRSRPNGKNAKIIDKMGIDQMGVDQMGSYLSNHYHSTNFFNLVLQK